MIFSNIPKTKKIPPNHPEIQKILKIKSPVRRPEMKNS